MICLWFPLYTKYNLSSKIKENDNKTKINMSGISSFLMDLNMGINSKCNAGNLLRNNFIYLSAGDQKNWYKWNFSYYLIELFRIWGQCFMVINWPKANKKIAGGTTIL